MANVGRVADRPAARRARAPAPAPPSPEEPALPDRSRLLRSLSGYGGRVAASFGVSGVGMGLQFAISILTARLLGVEGFGVYTYAFVWVTVLGAVAQLGFGPLATRELPRHVAARARGRARGFMGFALLGTAAASAAMAAGLAGAQALGLGVPFGWGLLAAGVVLQALGLLLSGALSGMQRIVQAQLVGITARPAVMIAGLAILILAAGEVTPGQVFVVAIASTAASVVGLAWLLNRSLSQALPAGGASVPDTAAAPAPGAPDGDGWEVRAWTTGGLALLATSITTIMMTNLDILMIGALSPPEEVGRYRAASRGVDLILIATGVAIQVMGPMLAKAIAEGHGGQARGLIMRASVTMAGAGLPICLGLWVGAEFYLGLFGPDFTPAATAMRILVAGQVIAILCGPAGMALVMSRRERIVLVLNLAALAVNLGLNFVLIPIYGLEGAAVATLVSIAGVRIAMAVLLLRDGYDPTLVAPLRAVLRRLRRP